MGSHSVRLFRTNNRLLNAFRQKPNISCLIIAVIVLFFDYITGRIIQFPIVYAVPVGMAAWFSLRQTAYTMALALPFVRVVFHYPWHETQSLPEAFLNAVITLLSLVFYAFLVDRTAWQTKALEKKVKTLEGILPICASCKRIRTENGLYEPIEQYIAENSEASFSHGLCPECVKKLYPEYSMKQEMKGSQRTGVDTSGNVK